MQNVLSFDDVAGTITVEGGATYTTINDYLKDKQWAVKNLATLPHFTVVRCCGASPCPTPYLSSRCTQMLYSTHQQH
jgi:xylitol oxidase